MRSFFEMVLFEYKKIFIRKGSVLTLVLITLFLLVSPALVLTGYEYIDGEPVESHYEAMLKDREYARELSGRYIDETLLSELKEAYSKIPPVERYTVTPEYEQYGRPYSEIFWIARSVYSELNIQTIQNLTPEKMQNFYNSRHEKISKEIDLLNISDKSKEKLIRLENEITTPFVYEYTGGWERFFVIMYTTGIFAAFVLAVCLAPVFAGEYSSGVSQLILSSKLGKNKLIMAKLFTAISFCIILSLFLSVSTLIVCIAIYGFDGANAPFQLYWRFPVNIFPFTIMQTAAIYFVCILFATVLIGAVTILLSSKFKTPFGVIIVVSLLIFVPLMFNISANNIVLYNLFRLLPSNIMGIWASFSYTPYEIFGLTVMPYVFLPLFAAVAASIMLPFAWLAFKNHQIS